MVADFGIARALNTAGGEKLTETGLALGTPYYMSPEQATGDFLDGRADQYALGCVLYEMLAGSTALPRLDRAIDSWPGTPWIRCRAFGQCARRSRRGWNTPSPVPLPSRRPTGLPPRPSLPLP